MNHINLSQFISHQNSKLTPEEHREIKEHIESCPVCQEKSKEYEQFLVVFRQSYQRSHSKDSSQCYDDSELLNFVEGNPSPKSQTKLWSHLLECQACMDKMLSLSRDFDELREDGVLKIHLTIWDKTRGFLSEVGTSMIEKIRIVWELPRSFGPAYRWVGLVAFLCVSMIAVIATVKSTFKSIPAINISDEAPITTRDDQLDIEQKEVPASDEKSMVTRDNQLDIGQKQVLLIHPANNSKLNIHRSHFQWNVPEKTVACKFLLLDDRGNIIWETSTEDKRLRLPDNITLNDSQLYFWRVEALLEDGSSRLSPMISFRNVAE